MGIESLYADGIEAEIQRKAADPGAVPPMPFSVWSMLSSGAKGVPAGGFEGAASIAEQLKTAQSETLRAGRPKVLQDQPDISGRQSSDFGFTKDVAERARATANGFIPPDSAHVADQTLFGLTRVGGKAVAALVASGGNPYIAGTILGAEETNTAFEALKAKGIDPNTALKVAGVQGLTAGASVALPMVGPTVKSTIGLGFLGGPGAFMAQEKMAKEILSAAGYHDEASLHNPTDPLGLILSTVLPAAFGGAHVVKLKSTPKPLAGVPRDADIKGAVALSADEQAISDAFERSAGNLKELREAVAKEKNPANKALLETELAKQTALAEANVGKHVVERASVTPEAVDAARTRVTQDALRKNLPDHPEAYAEVLRASDEVSAGRMPVVDDLDIETRFALQLRDHDAAIRQYESLKDSEGGKVLNTDVARELSPDYLSDRTRSAAVHEPASGFVKRLYAEKLAQMEPGGSVMFTSGGTGAGKTTAIAQTPTVRAMKEDAAIVYDTNMNSLPSAKQKIDQALEAGAQVNIVHVQRDPVDALLHGALPRAVRQEKEHGSGRTVPLVEHARTHRGAAEVIQQLAELYKDNPNVAIRVIDNTRGKGGARDGDLAFVRGFDYNGLEGRLHEALSAQHQSGAISDSIFRGTQGDSIPGTRNAVRAVDDRESAGANGRNALPDPRGTAEPVETKPAQSGDSQRVAALAKDNPRIAAALETAKAAAAEEAGAAKLVKVALECALGFGG